MITVIAVITYGKKLEHKQCKKLYHNDSLNLTLVKQLERRVLDKTLVTP